MKLSCSPHSPNLFSPSSSSSAPPSKKDLQASPSGLSGSSSGASSFRSATPSPPLSASATDEGIVKDMQQKRATRKMIMYQCTYPGCHEQRLSVDAMESHVRVE